VATIIKLKRSTTASSVPTTSNLADGEVAVNIIDKKIYQRNGNDIVEIANNSSSLATDLTNVSTNIVPDTDAQKDIGTIQKIFDEIFGNEVISFKDTFRGCRVFTRSGGLNDAQSVFKFRLNTSNNKFDEVYTNSGGLGTKAITLPTYFNDNNPAFLF